MNTKHKVTKALAFALALAMVCTSLPLDTLRVQAASVNTEAQAYDPEAAGEQDGVMADADKASDEKEDASVSEGAAQESSEEEGARELPETEDEEEVSAQDPSEAASDELSEATDKETAEASEEETLGDDAADIRAALTFSKVGGFNESIYAELSGVSESDITGVTYTCAADGTSASLSATDLNYLVREKGGKVRIDIVGVKGSESGLAYTLKVDAKQGTATQSGIRVYSYDRSGFAHFNYAKGVGAYNDNGTLKSNAIVLYVTDENKNDVELTYGGKTVRGIGNILNSNGAKGSSKGAANTNNGIIKDLANANIPLDIRFVGCVSETGLMQKGTFDAKSDGLIDGLTDYNSSNYGGSAKDNGHMARIKSGKNITLEGIGTDATIDGWGFHFIAESGTAKMNSAGTNDGAGVGFEVRNLTFINTPEDAVGMEGVQASDDVNSKLSASVERCWIHNNEFYGPDIENPAESDKCDGDGSVDFKRGQYFTCSYNYFEGCHKTNLVGSSDSSLQFNLTYHHNYWYMCKARGPLSRNANIHMYNNIVFGQTDYAQNVRANAYIFSEYNLFLMAKNPQRVDLGAIKSYNDSFSGYTGVVDGTVVSSKSKVVSNACQYAAFSLNYSSFETNAAQSYIPGNHYLLDTSTTQARKRFASVGGVLKEDPVLMDDVTMDSISAVYDKSKTENITTYPYKVTSKKIESKTQYSFNINRTSTIELSFPSETATGTGVLLNEAGELLLRGSGSVSDLPPGTYIIQANNLEAGDAKTLAKPLPKGVTITSMTITATVANEHIHNYKEELSQRVEPTCTTAGKKVSTCQNSTGCNAPVKTETIAALGHSWSKEYTIDVAATEMTPGSKSRHCTREGCDAKTDVTVIPATGGGAGETEESSEPSSETPGPGTEKTYIHDFTASGLVSSFYSISGKLSTQKGTVYYDGKTLTQCLKMESSTSVNFTAPGDGTLTLVFASGEGGQLVKVSGKEYTTDSSGVCTVSVAAGSVSITKKDGINLFYIVFAQTGAGSEPSSEEPDPSAGACDHDYDEVVIDPTCTVNGKRYEECTKCHNIKNNTIIPATGHTEEAVTEAVAATCTEEGSTAEIICSTCGVTLHTSVKTPALGHSFGSFIITVPATETTDGTKQRVCSACGDVETERIPALGGTVTPTGDITIREAYGYGEGAYVIWEPYVDGSNVISYKVAYSTSAGGAFTEIDDELIRRYPGYYRADVLGLKPGTYYLKITAGIYTKSTNTFIEKANVTTSALTVTAQDRSGFGFAANSDVSAVSVGAYNTDGTLKSNAKVIYVTAENAKTVTTTVQTGSKASNVTESVGFQTILDSYQKGYDTTPIDFRIIGCVTLNDLDHISSSEEGLQVKGKGKGVYSNMPITIEGVGGDAVFKDFGVLIRYCSNTEIKNLAVMNQIDDAISVDTDCANLWIHNLDLFYGKAGGDSDQAKGDGFVDIKKSHHITVSYVHFWDSGKCCLLDASPSATEKSESITYHHNWFDHSDSRHPRIRNSSATHIYNNYFDGNAKYGVGITSGGSAYVDHNYFRAVGHPIMIAGQGTDMISGKSTFSGEDGGMIKAYDNQFEGGGSVVYANSGANKSATQFDAYLASSASEQVPATYKTVLGGNTYSNFDTTAGQFYSYTPDAAADVPSVVTHSRTGAGRVTAEAMTVGGSAWTRVNYSGADSDYAVYTPLKEAITSYVSSLISIGGLKDTTYVEPDAPTRYTVSFDVQGKGANPSGISNIASGSRISRPADPEYDGFTFGGWYKDSACKNAWNFDTDKVTENLTLYAKWTETSSVDPGPGTETAKYTVTFDMNGIVSNPAAKTDVESGSVITLPSINAPGGFRFDGWYQDTAYTVPFTSETKVMSDLTVYGRFSRKTGETDSAEYVLRTENVLAKSQVPVGTSKDGTKETYMKALDSDVTVPGGIFAVNTGMMIQYTDNSGNAQETKDKSGNVLYEGRMQTQTCETPLEKRSIKVTLPSSGRIDVDSYTGSSTDDRRLALYNSNGVLVKEYELNTKSGSTYSAKKRAVYAFENLAAGDYYIAPGSTQKSINIYEVKATVASDAVYEVVPYGGGAAGGEELTHTHDYSVEIARKDATCSADGWIRYRCTGAGVCDAETKEVPITKTGEHAYDYASATYKWTTDYGKCTATAECNFCDERETVTVNAAAAVVTEPTADTEGTRKYTATFNAPFTTQIKTTAIPRLCSEGHTCTPAYSWADDLTTCTATADCSVCHGHFEETATAASQMTKEPTVDEKGVMTYTAAFDNALFATQTQTKELDELPAGHVHDYQVDESASTAATCKAAGLTVKRCTNADGKCNALTIEEVLPKTGIHTEAEPTYQWTGYTQCTAQIKCSVCEEVLHTENATITSKITVDAIGTAPGRRVYTATFVHPGLTPQEESELFYLCAEGHTWSIEYEWTQNASACKATADCEVCGGHREETATASHTRTKEPTEEEAGVMTHTAEFADPLFATQTMETDIPPRPQIGTGLEVTFNDYENLESVSVSGETEAKELCAYTYTGAPIIPDITVTFNGKTLREGIDYKKIVKNNLNVPKADAKLAKYPVVSVSGLGKYTLKADCSFYIRPVSIEKARYASVLKLPAGAAIAPKVVFNNKTLGKNKDYALTDDAGSVVTKNTQTTAGGLMTVHVNGKGNFAGSGTFVVETVDTSVKVDAISASFTSNKFYYTGEDLADVLTAVGGQGVVKEVKIGKTPAREDAYEITVFPEKVVGAGKYTVTVKPSDGNAKGVVNKVVTVLPLTCDPNGADPAAGKFEAIAERPDAVDYDPTGAVADTEGKLKAKLTRDGEEKVLVEGVDYTVSYIKNKKIGSGTVRYRLKGNYKGIVTSDYTINRLDWTNLDEDSLKIVIPAVAKYKAPGVFKASKIFVDLDHVAVKASEYQVKYYVEKDGVKTEISKSNPFALADGEKEGTVLVEITAKESSNFTGTVRAQMKVQRAAVPGTAEVADLSKAKVMIVSLDKDGNLPDIDAKKGTPTDSSRVVKKLEYTGSLIDADALENLSNKTLKYPYGAKIVVTLKVGSGWKVLSEDTDYTLEIVNNKTVGKASIVAEGILEDGKGYVGQKVQTIAINKYNFKTNELR